MINAQEEVDRMLITLRNKIRERGFTQLKVQADLKWGRSYISQLLTKQKSLRVEQVLQILDVIGIEPAEFFAELFKWPGEEGGAAKAGFVNDPVFELEMRRKLDHLQSSLEGLVRVLVHRDLLAANDSVAILGGSAAKGPLPPVAAKGAKKRRAREPVVEEQKPRRRRKTPTA